MAPKLAQACLLWQNPSSQPAMFWGRQANGRGASQLKKKIEGAAWPKLLLLFCRLGAIPNVPKAPWSVKMDLHLCVLWVDRSPTQKLSLPEFQILNCSFLQNIRIVNTSWVELPPTQMHCIKISARIIRFVVFILKPLFSNSCNVILAWYIILYTRL